jgi:hypothetical protein
MKVLKKSLSKEARILEKHDEFLMYPKQHKSDNREEIWPVVDVTLA